MVRPDSSGAEPIDNLTTLGYRLESNLTLLVTALGSAPDATEEASHDRPEHPDSPSIQQGQSDVAKAIATAVGILFVVQMVAAMLGTSMIQAFVDGDPDRTR